MQSTFDFVLRPLVDGLRNLFIEVRQSGLTIAKETPLAIPKRGVPLSLSLNYTPRNTLAGKVSFTIVIGYYKDGKPRMYSACRTHTIYSGKEDVQQVCDSLVVEVKNNIQQGHAADLRVDQNFRELREALRRRNSIELDKEFIELINARPFWTPLILAECTPDALSTTTFSNNIPQYKRLILQSAEGIQIHIISDPIVRLGRNRSCEIVTRVLGVNERELEQESLRISKFHSQIQWQGNQCILRDGGTYPDKGWRPSKIGLFVNGKQIPPGGELVFVPGQQYRVSFGEDLPNAFVFNARLYAMSEMKQRQTTCPHLLISQQSPVCLVLQRLQGPKWFYLILRYCALLDWLDNSFGNTCICTYSGGFQFNDGHTCDWIVPGQNLRAGTAIFRVLDSQKTQQEPKKH